MKQPLRYTVLDDINTGLYNLLIKYKPYKNCITCQNFDEEKELCKLCNQRPPAKVIAYGCPQYDDIENIPF
jgi:recombinational DNA repair protein RecR